MPDDDKQSAGRKANEALPPGRRDGQSSDKTIAEIGESAVHRPGPDGVHPDEIGDTFKKAP